MWPQIRCPTDRVPAEDGAMVLAARKGVAVVRHTTTGWRRVRNFKIKIKIKIKIRTRVEHLAMEAGLLQTKGRLRLM